MTTKPIASGKKKESRSKRRRRDTRAKLLEAGYTIMTETGVDAAKIKDITERADVGFGTFYNYFTDKADLARQILDCIIHDYGRRNLISVARLARQDPALIIPTSMRLVICDSVNDPMWQWWARRPDLLFDRMCSGFGPFALRDMANARQLGILDLPADELPTVWGLAVWMMVGGIHDIVVGGKPLASESRVIRAVMRMLGVEKALADRISSIKLPPYSKPSIDWTFSLTEIASG